MISAIILAGGKGSSAFPFSTIRNKVTVPILNTPAIRRLALQLKDLGIEHIIVLTKHLEQSIRYALKDISQISFIHLKECDDPASSIRVAIPSVSTPELMIIHGDIVTTHHTLKHFINTYKEQQPVTSVLASNQQPAPKHSLLLKVSSNRKLEGLDFNRNESNYWFCGAVIGKTNMIDAYIQKEAGIIHSTPLGVVPMPEGNIPSMLEIMLEDKQEISVISARDFVVDLDHPWDIIEANQKALNHFFRNLESSKIASKAKISDGADIASTAKLWLEEGANIDKNTIIKGNLFLGSDSQISYGAIIESQVFIGTKSIVSEYAKIFSESVLGDSNLVLHNAEFYGLTLDTVFMVHYCCISGMIGSHVDIGAGTISATWRFDNTTRPMKCKEHLETPPYHGNLTYIGDYCRTGINVMFMPGIRVGAYSCVGPGVIVNNDIDAYSLITQRQQLDVKPWGPDRYP
ncbi:MAG TPA: NTP transferase domain-containing protein [Candidatus Hydrogenedens sp.]|nr:NTP transferase domain-containing protein [Candidatus Hydrogenedens sp.]HOL19193.1 NTP transferase domain-containing protein [Candidatus Hydrogenedens sp.]HPP58409.1 NTP transferase domain-containing protein [Candidatus Hydrogenedens sp.]